MTKTNCSWQSAWPWRRRRCSAPPRTAATVLQDAQKALGAASTIQYSGTGMSAFVGQALLAGEPWPVRELSGFTETVNYDQKSAKRRAQLRPADIRRTAAEHRGQRRQGMERRSERARTAAGHRRGATTAHRADPARIREGGSRGHRRHAVGNRHRARHLVHRHGQVQARRHARRAEHGDEDRDQAPRHGAR